MIVLADGRANTESPFDSLASSYDRDFTRTLIGGTMREAVWRRMDARFAPGCRILEVNCGTGEDAAHLAARGVEVLATDESAMMVRATHSKAVTRGVSHYVDVHKVAIQYLHRNRAVQGRAPYDGLLSDFGGLNCVPDLPEAAEVLCGMVRPGGTLILCVMGPIVPWEWGWFLARGDVGRAFRRLRRVGVEWRGMRVRYPSVRATAAAFRPWCRVSRVSALGAILPPPFAESWAARHPRITRALNGFERKVEAAPLLTWLADHYVMELERR